MTPAARQGREDVCALLSAEPPERRVATVARVALEQRDPRVECPRYLAALDRALRDEPPPYGARDYEDIYRAASADGQWLAISLITNAEREGDGATRLWSLAFCATDAEEKQLIKRHAVDESSHALAYLALLDFTFPGAVTETFRAELNGVSPGYSMSHELFAVPGSPYARVPTVDDYIQMNIAEIRTTLHHLMQRSAIAAHSPPESAARSLRLLESLLRDELSHVAYTAVLIERHAEHASEEALHALFRRRVRDFNEITRKELGERKFD